METTPAGHPTGPTRIRTGPGIVWVASYPKSGNTWLSNLLYTYACGGPQDFGEQTRLVARYSPLLRKQRRGELTPAQAYRRLRNQSGRSPRPPEWRRTTFAKTHSLPREVASLNQLTVGALLIVRHPKDVLLSAINYLTMRGRLAETPREFASSFIEQGGHDQWIRAGYGTWVEHWQSWLGQTALPVHLLSYEQLKADPYATFGSALHFLGLDPVETDISAAVDASSFDAMKKREERRFSRDTPFMNAGSSGRQLADVDEYDLAGLDPVFDEAFEGQVRELEKLIQTRA